MPAKNSVKIYSENTYYHVYNRGVEKRLIFQDHQDYLVFIKYLRQYLDPTLIGSDPKAKTLFSEVELIAFCLMPNHFHLLIRQFTKNGITKLIHAVSTRYVMYFNQKYQRVGGLFQGKFKAISIENDDQLIHLSRYIHLNPSSGSDPISYPYSSYQHYIDSRSHWVKPEVILGYFNKNTHNYEQFITDFQEQSEELVNSITLES